MLEQAKGKKSYSIRNVYAFTLVGWLIGEWKWVRALE